MNKTWVFFGVLVWSATAMSVSLDPQEVADSRANLLAQTEVLKRQSAQQCPADYAQFYQKDSLKISLYYGYEDFEHKTLDVVHAYTMTEALRRPCQGTMQACGFKKSGSQLQKKIDGKNIVVQIHSTSVTDNVAKNLDPQTGYWEQDARSTAVRNRFYSDLQHSDIVLFSGHSRGGGGLGFNVHTAAQGVFDYIFKLPLRRMTQALEARPSQLKLFVVMSCKSQEYYRAAIEGANASTSLMVSTDDVFADEGEQISLGILNSVLTKKCSRELRASMRGVNDARDVINYIRR